MSGSLIHESETRTNVALDDFEKTIKLLFKNEFSQIELGKTVRDFEETRQEELGNYAKFWILLGVCAILAYPKFYRNKISFYLAMAEGCRDAGANLHHEFYTTLQTEVQRRLSATDDKTSPMTSPLYSSVHRHASLMLRKLQ